MTAEAHVPHSVADAVRAAQWKLTEPLMEGRALSRVAAAAGWLAVAVAVGATWWPAALALVGSLLSWAHARRTMVLRWAEEGPAWQRRALQAALPYPEEPNVRDLPGWTESLGLLAMAIAVGPWGVFGNDTAARTVAAGLVLLYLSTYLHNLAGHLNWELNPGPPVLRTIRVLIAPLFAGTAVAFLAPGTSDAVGAIVVWGGAGAVVLSTWRSARAVREQVAAAVALARLVQERVHVLDGAIVHAALKNPTRAVLNELDRFGVGEAAPRSRVRRLCEAVAAVETQFRLAHPWVPRTATEVVEHVALFRPDWGAVDAVVTEDVPHSALGSRDAELVFLAVSDLMANAYAAEAAEVAVALRASGEGLTRVLALTVTCRCGRPITEIPPGGSLRRLAQEFAYAQGSFVVDEHHDGSHTFAARWPSPQVVAA